MSKDELRTGVGCIPRSSQPHFTRLEMKAESPSKPASLLRCAGNRGTGRLVPLASGLREYVVVILRGGREGGDGGGIWTHAARGKSVERGVADSVMLSTSMALAAAFSEPADKGALVFLFLAAGFRFG